MFELCRKAKLLNPYLIIKVNKNRNIFIHHLILDKLSLLGAIFFSSNCSKVFLPNELEAQQLYDDNIMTKIVMTCYGILNYALVFWVNILGLMILFIWFCIMILYKVQTLKITVQFMQEKLLWLQTCFKMNFSSY